MQALGRQHQRAPDDTPRHYERHRPGQTTLNRLVRAHRASLVAHTGASTDGEEARTLRPLQAAAITYRIAFGPRAGQKVLTLSGAILRVGAGREPLCDDIDGFSRHAAVRVEADDRKRLEQLCRYTTRQTLSDERVQLSAAGALKLEFEFDTPWRDGTTPLVMSTLEFMLRLAALVPRPLATATSTRSRPGGTASAGRSCSSASSTSTCSTARHTPSSPWASPRLMCSGEIAAAILATPETRVEASCASPGCFH